MTSRDGDPRRTSVRLGLQTGLLVVGVLAVVGLLIFVIYARAADTAADTTLREVTSNIDRPNEAPPGVHVVVITPTGRKESSGMPAGFPDEAALAAVARDGHVREVDRTVHGREYTVRTVRVGNRVTQAVLDRHEIVEERARILTSLLIAGGVGVLLAALVATWLARRAMQPLTDSLAMQRRFVADASHELRTPLTLLTTRVQLARRRTRSVSEHEAVLAEIETDVVRLVQLAEHLLDVGHGSAEDTEGCDLAAVAEEEARRHGAGHEVAGPVPVRLTPAAVRQLVGNLLDNAARHGGAPITVRVDAVGECARLQVVDGGPGMSPELLATATRRFTRSPESRATEGFGLGLSLVEALVVRSGGELRLCSGGHHHSYGALAAAPACAHDGAMCVSVLLPLDLP